MRAEAIIECRQKRYLMCAQKWKTDDELRRAVQWRVEGELYDAIWTGLRVWREAYFEGTLEDEEEDALAMLANEAQERTTLVDDSIREKQAKASGTYVSPSSAEQREEQKDRNPEESDVLTELVDATHFIGTESISMLSTTSAYFGWKASRLPEVMQFRNEVLGGRLLSREQAGALLNSYAARFLSPRHLSELGVPLHEHAAEIVEGYREIGSEDKIDDRVSIRIDPPGLTLRLRYADFGAGSAGEDYLTRREKREGVTLAPYTLPLPDIVLGAAEADDPESNVEPILIGNLNTAERPSEVWPGSLVDRIHSLSEVLATVFGWPSRVTELPAWSPQMRKDAAAMFLLTDAVPSTRPIVVRTASQRGSTLGMRRVELSIAPWVSDQDVVRAYRRAQRASIDKRNKWPKPKTREVVRFVLRRRRPNGYKKPSWPVLHDEWNREHPDDRFEDYRHLRGSFERGWRWIEETNFF